MKRWIAVGLLAVVALTAVALVAFNRKVQVSSGTRYVCTYGEALGSDVRTIWVSPKDVAKYAVRTKRITCSRHREAEALYLRAQQRLSEGDVKGAGSDLAAVIKLDASFKQASSQLQQIKQGKKPPSDGAAKGGPPQPPIPATSTVDPGTAPSPAMDAYRDLVPDDIAGFTAEAISTEAESLTRSYVPRDKSRYDQLVIMVQQCGSTAASREFVDGAIRSAYPSGTSVTVSGMSGWFGVNGSGFAALAVVRGEAAVVLELHVTRVPAKSLEQDLRGLTAKLPL